MPNAIKINKKKVFKKSQEKNGNLSRNYLVRPLAPEFTKKFNHPGDIFLHSRIYRSEYYKKKSGDPHFQYQFIKCRDCGKVLEICQIQRKNISNCREFAVFTYYCQKCKLTYYIFNFINKEEEKRDGL